MSGAIPPLPQYAFIALCLVKQRDNFTFTRPTNRSQFSYSQSRAWHLQPLEVSTFPPSVHFSDYVWHWTLII
jgi:hypothetical protein